MLTKVKGALWLGVFVALGVIAVTQLNVFGPDPQPLRVHTPTKTAFQKRQAVRFLAAWTREYPPTQITYWVGNQSHQLSTSQLPVLVGRWTLDVPYDPSLTYAMNVNQTDPNADITDCQLTLIPSGFTDEDRVRGHSAAHCWINPAV